MKWTKALICVLLLATLIASVLGACPGNCGGHGTCSGSICSCQQYYEGTDCSIYDRPIAPSQTIRNTVATRQWHYYSFTVSAGTTSFAIDISQLDTDGDVDTYIQFGALPRRDSSYAFNTTFSSSYTTEVTNPQPGLWYAGIYGFLACTYDVTLRTSGSSLCPNACSGHGTCASTGRCSCEGFWAGSDCSSEIQNLVSGQQVSASVAMDAWQYYYVNITNTQNALRITVNETSSGDSDLYVQKDEIPTNWYYLYRDAGYNANYNITIPAELGTYFLGILGYRAVSYIIKAEYGAVETCIGRCSDHGTCSGRTCNCRSGFTGSNCEEMVAGMSLDSWVGGYVATTEWNYYHITADTASNLIVSVHQGDTGDCDLYVRAGIKPQRFDYDYSDTTVSRDFNITIENPQDQTWYIGVYGWASCSYQIRLTTSAVACPGGCSGHGDCIQGRCQCASSYAGADCSSALHALHNGQVRTSDTVSLNQWNYYRFEVGPSAGYVVFEVLEHETVGSLWLFVSQGAPPTLSDYEYSETSLTSPNHLIHFQTAATTGSKIFYVGVYGDPLSYYDTGSPYTIVAYSPQFS